MRIGVSLPYPDQAEPEPQRVIADGAARLERIGFESVWSHDVVGRGYVTVDPLITLAIAATVTSKVELGTSILQLTLRNPIDLAHRVMTLQLVTGDRLLLGVGAGSSRPDFELLDQGFEDRFARFDRNLDLMRRLWAGETVDGACLSVWDAIRGGPKVIVGSWFGGRWFSRAQELDGWMASAGRGGQLEEGIRRYRELGPGRAIVANVHVAFDGSGKRGEPFSLRCDEDEARARLRWLADLGFDDVILRTTDHSDDNLSRIRDLYHDA